MKPLQPSIDDRRLRCVRCGCTKHCACIDLNFIPCYWILDEVCSHCFLETPAWKPGMKVYQCLWPVGGGPSLIVLQHVMGEIEVRQAVGTVKAPVIIREESRAVERRHELLRPRATLIDELSVSMLADCLADDATASGLGPAFAAQHEKMLHRGWTFNEFQLRHWAGLNKIPY